MQKSKLLRKAKEAYLKADYQTTVHCLNKILTGQAQDIPSLMLRGESYCHIEKFDLAINDFATVVQLQPKNISALNNLGACLIRCNKRGEAKEIFEYLLELEPNNVDGLINLSSIYNDLSDPQTGMKLAFEAIKLSPKNSIAYNNLGASFGSLMLLEEAEQAYKTAYVLNNKSFEAAINLANLQEKNGRTEEAIRTYESLLNSSYLSQEQRKLVRYYLSFLYLGSGQLEIGWEYYEDGFCSLLPPGGVRSSIRFDQPKWSGSRLTTQTLLVWREQGLGDEIEFLTCLEDVTRLVDKVILECDARLVELYQRIYPTIVVRPQWVHQNRSGALNDFDFQCPVGSLPMIFRKKRSSFHQENKNFLPRQDLVEKFKSRLTGSNKLLVGICWRSGKLSPERNQHYTGLADWRSLLKRKDIQFVNLQYGECEDEINSLEFELGISILRWSDIDLKNSLEDVVALMSVLDCVVTVGTAVSSLAGMVGVPTFLLTKKSWMLLGLTDTYPWYSSVKPVIAYGKEYVADKLKDIPLLIQQKFPHRISS